tara:strand:- start:2651 stop:3160 length:510 start_codon:yes stop_codon:yes gene_type:complete
MVFTGENPKEHLPSIHDRLELSIRQNNNLQTGIKMGSYFDAKKSENKYYFKRAGYTVTIPPPKEGMEEAHITIGINDDGDTYWTCSDNLKESSDDGHHLIFERKIDSDTHEEIFISRFPKHFLSSYDDLVDDFKRDLNLGKIRAEVRHYALREIVVGDRVLETAYFRVR